MRDAFIAVDETALSIDKHMIDVLDICCVYGSESKATISIFVRNEASDDNKPLLVQLEPTATIADIKSRLAQQLHLPVRRMRLVFGGRELSDWQTLYESHIAEQTLVTLVHQLEEPATVATPLEPTDATEQPDDALEASLSLSQIEGMLEGCHSCARSIDNHLVLTWRAHTHTRSLGHLLQIGG